MSVCFLVRNHWLILLYILLPAFWITTIIDRRRVCECCCFFLYFRENSSQVHSHFGFMEVGRERKICRVSPTKINLKYLFDFIPVCILIDDFYCWCATTTGYVKKGMTKMWQYLHSHSKCRSLSGYVRVRKGVLYAIWKKYAAQNWPKLCKLNCRLCFRFGSFHTLNHFKVLWRSFSYQLKCF